MQEMGVGGGDTPHPPRGKITSSWVKIGRFDELQIEPVRERKKKAKGEKRILIQRHLSARCYASLAQAPANFTHTFILTCDNTRTHTHTLVRLRGNYFFFQCGPPWMTYYISWPFDMLWCGQHWASCLVRRLLVLSEMPRLSCRSWYAVQFIKLLRSSHCCFIRIEILLGIQPLTREIRFIRRLDVWGNPQLVSFHL